MAGMKVKKEERDRIIRNIQVYFLDEHDQEVGDIAAEGVLQFFWKEIGPYIYNDALGEARKVIAERMLSIEDELYVLEKPIQVIGRN
jgi:uncharacterized protein (DUF2164 family)